MEATATGAAAPQPANSPVQVKPAIPDASDKKMTAADAEPEPWRQVKHRYKANGQEVEVDYDELVRRAEKADGAEKRLYEATKKEREILARLDNVKNAKSFDAIVELLGDDARALALAEEYVWNKIQEEKLPPEKKEALAEKRRADAAEKQLKDLQALDEARSKAERDSKAQAIINREINDAISEAEAQGLSPEDVPDYVERVVENMILHLEYLEECEAEGIQPTKAPLSPKDVLRRLQEKDSKRASKLLKKLSAKDLKELLSKEQLEELRSAEIDSLYSSTPVKPRAIRKEEKSDAPVDPFTDGSESPKQRRRPSTNDWFSAMEKRFNGR